MKTSASHAPARWLAASLLLAGAALAAVPTASRADNRAEGPPRPQAGHAMPGAPGLPGLPMQGPGMQRMLQEVQATPEQREQIRRITDAAAADMRSQHEAARGLQQRVGSLLTGPTVDAAAAESLRQQMMAQHDQASRRMMQVMLDIANVLTPEQRQQLAERMARRAEAGPRGEPGGRPQHGGPRGERTPAS
ncbi:Spy/CpxP family protein refolding chaperone [Aquincola sp. J276]|uniref:Spy/CpxP family protein refolding chaperone n=1 Tax=Aquincola sp. J276 TaxID=2898432 RepID=UPI002151BA84|nr:Spy/CpxP family protein refolding chaperone [Aquincola sp. J276]MCR5868442.1 Spy/CpxP family protein refolding chaperone [Aquincola sp. J276]